MGAPGLIGHAKEATALHVPAEDEPHELTFMQWPVSRRVHPDQSFLAAVQQTIADVANTIAEFEPVIMLTAAQNHQQARRLLSAQVELWDIPTEDLWCRDSGPLIARTSDGRRVLSHIQFNGWGDKQVHQRDRRIAETVAERLGFDVVPSGLIGEAGGIEHDGHGLLLAHESSWVIGNRNPGLSIDEIERRLLTAYGASRMIWSPGVRGQDITDYHIDSLARFTGPGRVLINLPEEIDDDDPFHKAALQTYERLVEERLDVEVIPDPNAPRVRAPDFVASYANYYVCNGAVIAAQFGDRETDAEAQKALSKLYPER
ncbi:MAG: agmatine deiminase family protein, partial [Pseudomonadota bacterium]